MLIKDLLDLKRKVNLLTRPRRFGRPLNLGMFRYFFEDTGNNEKNVQNRALFEDLKIILTSRVSIISTKLFFHSMGRFLPHAAYVPFQLHNLSANMGFIVESFWPAAFGLV